LGFAPFVSRPGHRAAKIDTLSATAYRQEKGEEVYDDELPGGEPGEGSSNRAGDDGSSGDDFLPLDEEGERLRQEAEPAAERIKSGKHFDDWMRIGRFVSYGQALCMRKAGTNKPEGKKYNTVMREWLRRYRLHTIIGDSGMRSRLVYLVEHEAEVIEWRKTLMQNHREKLNSPNAVYPAFKKFMEPPTAEKKEHAPSARELELQDEIQHLQGRVNELEDKNWEAAIFFPDGNEEAGKLIARRLLKREGDTAKAIEAATAIWRALERLIADEAVSAMEKAKPHVVEGDAEVPPAQNPARNSRSKATSKEDAKNGTNAQATRSLRPRYFECPKCGFFHAPGWRGDCRTDGEQFDLSELEELHGRSGWDQVDVAV
jgi:hypothetical protein